MKALRMDYESNMKELVDYSKISFLHKNELIKKG
jgi:hypothetical protein